MIIIDSTLEAVKNLIIRNISDSQTEVKLAYQKNVIPNPLRKNYVVFNMADVVITPFRDETGRYHNLVRTKLSVNIHCAETADPKKLLRIFSEIITIIDEDPVRSFDEAGCGPVVSDPDSNSICLKGYITVSTTT